MGYAAPNPCFASLQKTHRHLKLDRQMNYLRTCLFVAFTTSISLQPASCATRQIDVSQEPGGVSLGGINRAIEQARSIFGSQPNDTVVIQLPAGRFSMVPSGQQRSIDVSDIAPGPAGRLILRGPGMTQTVLVFDTEASEIVRPQYVACHILRPAFYASAHGGQPGTRRRDHARHRPTCRWNKAFPLRLI